MKRRKYIRDEFWGGLKKVDWVVNQLHSINCTFFTVDFGLLG